MGNEQHSKKLKRTQNNLVLVCNSLTLHNREGWSFSFIESLTGAVLMFLVLLLCLFIYVILWFFSGNFS
ncbi:rCG38920 [Rattus norvegicus]|uniref:RCG38920 n=1 Tax=Rattus norvegicus TaxID=10116 RepID=A6KL62_RAT|nr:rCG38920 [Rattus norvegicus]